MTIDETVNALIEAVEAIEHELGIAPSSVYSDVRVRLDILEARINNPLVPSPTVESPFIIGNAGVTISTGTGLPISAPVAGSLYLRQDGYNHEALYGFRPDGVWQQISNTIETVSGNGAAGAAFDLLMTSGNNFSMVDGYSYDLNIRVLIANTTGSPTCARFIVDVLAHVDAGALILDVVNATLSNDNSTGWAVSLNPSAQDLVISIDASGSDDRKAIATIEWRELPRT